MTDTPITDQLTAAQQLLEAHGYLIKLPGCFDTGLVLTRADFARVGYDASDLSDTDLADIADALSLNHSLNQVWDRCLEGECERRELPLLGEKGGDDQTLYPEDH